MPFNPVLAACGLASVCHQDQKRRGGEPYILHPIAVAEAVEMRLKPIAYLHDAMEDSKVPEAVRWALMTFPEYIQQAVADLTKRAGEDYFAEYLPRVKANPDALTVKLADIAHNLSDQPTERQKAKYKRALEFLKGS